ncbi:MAG TPA: enoyl-CoA hydratase [Victivallales bacterium]|nr:enoyl-CoA hydratase [Victivallales bacterium]
MSDNLNTSDNIIIKNDKHGISQIIINRPKAYNALSIECMESLIKVFKNLSSDSSVKVIILSGSGKGFCAGHDLREMRSDSDRIFQEKIFKTCSKAMLSITSSPRPVIAKVHGVASAAGCQLVASCDLAIAEEKARFATPGVNLGLFCSTPMVALSRNISKKHAMEMLLLGDLITANRAYEMGLVNKVVHSEELDKTTYDLAIKIAAKSSLALSIGKKAFYKQTGKNLNEAYEYCSHVMTDNMMTQDAKEGIDAFIEKRKPKWHNR